jgi:hypothetical protein
MSPGTWLARDPNVAHGVDADEEERERDGLVHAEHGAVCTSMPRLMLDTWNSARDIPANAAAMRYFDGTRETRNPPAASLPS